VIVSFTPDAALTARHVRQERTQLILLAIFALTLLLAYFVVPTHWALVGLLSYLSTLSAFAIVRFDYQRRTGSMFDGNPHFNEIHEIELTPDRLVSRCSHVASEYAWSGIECVTETSEFYVLSNGPAAGLTVPKRALTDDTDRELRDIVRLAAPDRGANLARELGRAAPLP